MPLLAAVYGKSAIESPYPFQTLIKPSVVFLQNIGIAGELFAAAPAFVVFDITVHSILGNYPTPVASESGFVFLGFFLLVC